MAIQRKSPYQPPSERDLRKVNHDHGRTLGQLRNLIVAARNVLRNPENRDFLDWLAAAEDQATKHYNEESESDVTL